MASDPADVGSAPVDVVLLQIEDQLGAPGALEQIAAGSVQHAFGFSGGAAGVENVERMFGIKGRRDILLRRFIFQLVPPEVAALLPGYLFLGALDYDAFFDGGAILHGGVGGFFQGDDLSATEAAVGGDQEFGFAIGDAVGDGGGAESAEDHGMDGADPGAG